MSRDKDVRTAMSSGIGVGKPVHPFAVTVEDPVANAIVPEGYGIKYHAYHTITEGVLRSTPILCAMSMVALTASLPTGTSLPGGAVLPMSSVADFPMVLPQGTKMPGGVMVPIVMERTAKAAAAAKGSPDPSVSYNDASRAE